MEDRSRRPTLSGRAGHPGPRFFPGVIDWLGSNGVDQRSLAQAIGRDQSTVSRLLAASGGLVEGIKRAIATRRGQYLVALSDPGSLVVRDLVGLALFDVGVFAAPEHVRHIAELFAIARELKTMLSPGQRNLVIEVLRARRPVVLFAPDLEENRVAFTGLCRQLAEASVSIDTLTWIAGPADSLGVGVTPTAIVNPRTASALGLVGLDYGDAARPSALAFVLAGQGTRRIADNLCTILRDIDIPDSEWNVFELGPRGKWRRVRGIDMVSRAASGPAASLDPSMIRRLGLAMRKRLGIAAPESVCSEALRWALAEESAGQSSGETASLKDFGLELRASKRFRVSRIDVLRWAVVGG